MGKPPSNQEREFYTWLYLVTGIGTLIAAEVTHNANLATMGVVALAISSVWSASRR